MSLVTTEIANLQASENLRYYLENSLSDNTRRAYRKDMEHYTAWGGRVPESPEDLASYLTEYAGTLSIATLRRRLVSIAKAHNLNGYPDPGKHELVRLTFRGIRRVHGRPQRRVSPILKDDLVVILSHIPETKKGLRDKALLMLGFCAALRRSELAAVRIEDLEFTSQGIVLTLPRSKTDQDGQGRKIAVPKGQGRVCPMEIINAWKVHLSANSSWLFPAINKGGRISEGKLSDRAIADIIKYYATKAGMNAENFSGHSLRSGLCSSAAQNGVPAWKIRRQTGHKSDAMLAIYIRESDLFTNNAAGLF